MITLKNDGGDFIYLDVVTRYSESFSSQLSQHPVDGSGVVTDHVIKMNPKFQLTGFLTGADFNFSKPDINREVRNTIGIDQLRVETDVATPVEITSDGSATNLLPDFAGQFFTDTLPTIDNINEGRNASYSEKILFDVLQRFYENKSKLTLFEFDGGEVVDGVTDVFITNLSINESAQTGDSLAFDISLEKVTFAELVEAEIPEDVQEDFRIKKEAQVKKGPQSSSQATLAEQEKVGKGSSIISLIKAAAGG